MSDFFEPPPQVEEEPELDEEWEGPPVAVVPVSIPIERVVAENAEATVYLASVSAYPAGFKFDVFVVIADEESELDPFDWGHQTLAQRTGEIPPGQLRIGFLFADGSKATNTGRYFRWYSESGKQPDAPVMFERGSDGGEAGRWHSSYWVWPLPSPGKLEFLCEWPEAGIPLTRQEIDAQMILDGAAHTQEIFPAE